jgi:adenine-specific DNA-methyltransferase
VRAWVKNEDFLDAKLKTTFSHIVGNPPYIRWDAVPATLRATYKKRFSRLLKKSPGGMELIMILSMIESGD